MNLRIGKSTESILGMKMPVQSNRLPIISIFVIAMLILILPACAKADFNQTVSSGAESRVNQTVYLKAFDEGYYLGGLYVLAQSNATIAQEYNVLIQQHNDLLNRTLSEEDAESNLLAKVPIPARAPRKPIDPWEL